jgi:3'-phosphoadenosine 5'-phosphosulfate sulfotransferase (PAPS reductase)/FAD synthetase
MTEPADRFRKRAPGHAADHPDWVLSQSGGIDSAAAAITALRAIETDREGGNFAKKPLAIYLDTRIGVPLNRIYVEQFCDWLGIQLWTLRTDESFLEWLRRDGAPGGGAHQEVRNELKDRQVSLLRSKLDNAFFVLGIAADESETRARFPKVREIRRSDNGKLRHVEVYPVHRLTRKERVEIILRSDCPINPLWTMRGVITDCGCLANGDPSELDRTIEQFPAFGQRLKEWEESITHDGLEGTLGWDGLTADEKVAKRDGLEQSTLPMCGEACGRRQAPAEIRALKARANGATIERSVSILYEDEQDEPGSVAIAGGGNTVSSTTDTDTIARRDDRRFGPEFHEEAESDD